MKKSSRRGPPASVPEAAKCLRLFALQAKGAGLRWARPTMLYYLIAAALVLHTVFWGIGLSWLVLPRRWHRWWWALAPGFGLGLQSAVVWAGAHTPLAGTNAYAMGSELLPLGLLVAAVARMGRPAALRSVRAGWSARGLAIMMIAAGGLLLWPMAQRGSWTLTSSSLGSCDQADYAASVRVFQEFSKDDRAGFMGLSEVTQVGTAENFFDYCLRLNHFIPPALLAHHGAVFDLQAHQLVSVLGVVLALLNAALVMLLARVAVGLRGLAGLIPAALYLFSPLGAYAVHHGALGQLFAAHGIALLTLATILAARGVRAGLSVWLWAPVVLNAFWLLAGSYNFILTVALAPAGAWLLGDACLRRNWREPARVAGMLLAAAAACAVLFWGRFDGLIERFRLFEQYDFGWPVPMLSAEGWLGLLRDTGLHAWPQAVRFALSAWVVMVWVAGIVMVWRRHRAAAIGALALVLPVLAGWSLLAWESRVRPNASYDAFKLLSVFYPGVLAGVLVGWNIISRSRSRGLRWAGWAAVTLVLAVNLRVGVLFAREMAVPPLRVDRMLLDIRRLEAMPRVTSLNLRVEKFWSRLWANTFLLRKAQYFPHHTYEGRKDTALKGEWDLSDSLLRSQPLPAADFVDLNPRFYAVRVAAPGRVDLAFGEGWHPLEELGATRWRWSMGTATIRINNPAPHPQKVTLQLHVRALEPGRLHVELAGARLGVRPLSGNPQRLQFPDVVLPPGDSILTLQPDRPAVRAAEGDARLLSVSLSGFSVEAGP
jgi:hypothetical protein